MFKLLLQDVKDRLQGNKARANARLGLVNPPAGTGKLIWIVAGQSYDSVLMAAALLAAIREKRQDVRLVLTYETEYQDVIVQQMSGLKKIGFGYGCGDSVLAVKKMLNRLLPFAVILVGDSPAKSLLKVLSKENKIHKIACQLNQADWQAKGNEKLFEACYPHSFADDKLSAHCENVSEPFDVLTRLVQSQVDKQLGAMLCGERHAQLFQVHNPGAGQLDNILSLWKKSDIAKNNLLVISTDKEMLSAEEISTFKNIAKQNQLNTLLLSKWQQQAVAENHILIADEKKWYAALCASATASHLFAADMNHFWQMVASGSVVTSDVDNHAISQDFKNLIQTRSDFSDILFYWQSLLDNPLELRKNSDALRKYFWQKRRQAETQVDELLQRVYDW